MRHQSEQLGLRLATVIALAHRPIVSAKRPVSGVQVGGKRQSLASALVDRSKLCLAVVIAVVGGAGKLWAEDRRYDGSGTGPASIIAVEFDAPTAGMDFATGDTTRVRFNFNQNVSVDTTNGVPTAAVALGLAYRHKVPFRYSDEESQDAVLVFTREVSDSDIMDRPKGLWISANSVSLNGGTISNNGTGFAVDLTHPQKYTRYTVNYRTALHYMAVQAENTMVPITRNDGVRVLVFGLGQSITVAAWFKKAVQVNTDGGVPYVRLVQEGHGPYHAEYRRGSGTKKLEFVYEVKSGDTSDLRQQPILTIPANGLVNWNGGLVREHGLILNGDRITNERGIPVYHEHYRITGGRLGDVAHWFAIDGVLPVLHATQKPTVQDKAVVLTYAEPLDEDSVPSRSAFSVTMQGEPASVTAVALENTVSGGYREYGKVTLRLAASVTAGVEVAVNYAVPASDPIRDLAGNKAAAFANVSVTNNSTTVKGPLTAAFEDMPESHDGETEFAFRVRFSEGIRNAIASIRDRAFKVTGGSVVNASRVNGNKQHWEIKIQPAGDDDVVIALEANRGCGSGPCTEDRRRLAKRLEETVKGPLTAAFEDMPESHDGETEFAFRVRFSEGIRNAIASIRDRAFKVTGGSVVNASRVNGNKQHWEIKIQPAGDDDVVIALEANRGCGSGPCTEDRRRLAKRLEETVEGPGVGKRLSPVAESIGIPAGYALGAAYPNPFNPEITIEFSVSRDGPVKIEVFNAAGQRLSILVDETLRAGIYKTVWDGLGPNGMRGSSGVYLYRMQAGDFVATRSMTLLK